MREAAMNLVGGRRFLYLVGAVMVVVLAMAIWTRSGILAPPVTATIAPAAPITTAAPGTPATTVGPAVPGTPPPAAPATSVGPTSTTSTPPAPASPATTPEPTPDAPAKQ
jgi:hypothetical protein